MSTIKKKRKKKKEKKKKEKENKRQSRNLNSAPFGPSNKYISK